MFYDLQPNYKDPDDFSMHTGCPVVKGVKWNAVKWIHGVPFRGEKLSVGSISRSRSEDPRGAIHG